MRRTNEETHTIEKAEAIGETEASLKVKAPDFATPQWVPKSQIHDDSEVYKSGTSGKLVVTQWLAEQRGWV